jgi:hypothetical protein
MYDTSARDRGYDSAAVRQSPLRAGLQDEAWSAPEIPVPEAELLRIIGRVLDEQRARTERPEPLVDRIETILGTRFQAANDTGFRREPSQFDETPAAREEVRPAGFPRSRTARLRAVTIRRPFPDARTESAFSRSRRWPPFAARRCPS